MGIHSVIDRDYAQTTYDHAVSGWLTSGERNHLAQAGAGKNWARNLVGGFFRDDRIKWGRTMQVSMS